MPRQMLQPGGIRPAVKCCLLLGWQRGDECAVIHMAKVRLTLVLRKGGLLQSRFSKKHRCGSISSGMGW